MGIERHKAKASLLEKADNIDFLTATKEEYGKWLDSLTELEFIILIEMHDEFKTPLYGGLPR